MCSAFGSYHASVVATAGNLVAKLTYGASREKAAEYFERAIDLAPALPAVYAEYAKGLLLLKDKKATREAVDLLVKGAALTPQDAMEELDIRYCQTTLAHLN